MQKKKKPHTPIIPAANRKTNNSEAVDAMFGNIMMDMMKEGQCGHDHDLEDDFYAEQMMSILPNIIRSTIDMAKLVIDNRVRNSDRMTDDDIYQIHRDAFKHLNSVFTED
ncbi:MULTISPECIES: hypothetical protein [Rickettsieae]|uniref:hypothetical protein n=1 Tax=Rickettsieae TaxID=33988 RepID=UPI000B9AE661|nr:hypothetical protein [Rickettsia endosymbiont of Culicoides newsteadi]OZG32018.1 hypothetical protein RiCNE_05780 [Rickettsia endosymbiont of Culicoides newsteadi]